MGMKYAQAKRAKSGKASMDGSMMTAKQLRDFAATKTAKLPGHTKPKKQPADLGDALTVKRPTATGRY
jgi:hypothetical protein